MIVHILSCTHKYDRSIDCMAVAGDLLFKEGLPSDVWEECLSASLYCAPTNATIDKNCMESVSVLYDLMHVCVYTYTYICTVCVESLVLCMHWFYISVYTPYMYVRIPDHYMRIECKWPTYRKTPFVFSVAHLHLYTAGY